MVPASLRARGRRLLRQPGQRREPRCRELAHGRLPARTARGSRWPARRSDRGAHRQALGVSADFDAIVVGAGAAGGIAACVLAEAGKRVLLVEQGRWRSHADSGHRDHLRNHRLQVHGVNTGPATDGHPRVFVDPSDQAHVVRPHEDAYHNNASAVGSGTLLYGGLAWRFHLDDFRMKSRYGTPPGSSLTDWPITYADLAPWYERAEHEIGVSGEASDPHAGPRERDYSMPPLPPKPATARLRAGAARLGLNTFSPPILVNTVRRDGRRACIQCGSCVGFPCPNGAKNGTQNTVIPRALATGRCELMTGAVVERIATDAAGRVVGIDLIDLESDEPAVRRRITARAVVVSAGAIESARLLLASRSDAEPHGLGNNRDLVGRNLQGHFYPTVFGLFEDEVENSQGPGVTIATTDFVHGNEDVIAGAMLADDFVMLPAIFWKQALPPDLPRFGLAAKHFMRDNFRRVTQIKGPVHEVPNPDCRVTLDPQVTDRNGRPVARLSGVAHPETMRTVAAMHGKAREWLEASGAVRTWGGLPKARLSAGQHQAGTCRMGESERVSVTDPFGRVWGHENLFVSDASLHPTNGAYNPVLTIMAMAFRNADRMAKLL
ncbi:MAG: glucose-methanol-choline oxidoreductase [Mesorhizobium amorphae]|nr:MAG: glucose-methanol-choline oxidoreductase [Mesorhizobium amorphae]